MTEKKLIPCTLSSEENSTYTGLDGEIVGVSGKGIALHDGVNQGGLLLTPSLSTGDGFNICRNSNFYFTQNGTSWMGVSGNTYISDGWFMQNGGGSTANVARVGSYSSDFKQGTHLQVTTITGGGSGSFNILSQRYPNPARFSSKDMNLSLIAKSSSNCVVSFSLGMTFADAGTPNREILLGFESLTANTAKEIDFSFVAPAVSESDVINNNVDSVYLYMWLESGDDFNGRTGGQLPINATFDVGNFKLEFSKTKTPYNFGAVSEEQSKVFEFYEKRTVTQFFYPFSTTGTTISSCALTIDYAHPKWSDTIANITYSTSFVGTIAINSKDRHGFTMTGIANNASSAARVTSYTVDAEIQP